MRGALRSEWLRGERTLGFEGHQIVHCKFTFTPELSHSPITNVVYKGMPTNVNQKPRNPHVDVVFDASFGKCIRFLAANSRPRMLQRDDDMAPISKRTVFIYFPRKSSIASDAAQVDEADGVHLMKHATALRGEILTPPIRRAFPRYWVNLANESPLDTCGNMAADLPEIDASFGPTLPADAYSF